MRKLIGYIFSWTLFWLGHWTSLVMGVIPKLYSAYRWFMFKSCSIQDWADNKTPWKHIEQKNSIDERNLI